MAGAGSLSKEGPRLSFPLSSVVVGKEGREANRDDEDRSSRLAAPRRQVRPSVRREGGRRVVSRRCNRFSETEMNIGARGNADHPATTAAKAAMLAKKTTTLSIAKRR